MARKPHKTKRKQHTVNRAYLERFADETNHLHVFDKPTRRDFARSASELTWKEYYYDTDDSADQHIEDWFSRTVEPRLLDDLRHLDDSALRVRVSAIGNTGPALGALGVPFDIRRSLAYGLIIQELRTAISRSDMLQASSTALAGIGRLLAMVELGRDPGRLTVDFGEYGPAQQHAQLFRDPEWADTAIKVMRYPMALLLSEPGHRFYTSDNPVVLSHPDPEESPGWLVPGVEIYYPIRPNMVLAFCDIPERAQFDDQLIRVKPSFVDFLNELQVCKSNRQIYCSSPDWAVARSILDAYPELGREDRPRTAVHVPDWFRDNKDGESD